MISLSENPEHPDSPFAPDTAHQSAIQATGAHDSRSKEIKSAKEAILPGGIRIKEGGRTEWILQGWRKKYP